MSKRDPFFIPLSSTALAVELPDSIENPFDYSPHPLARIACEDLQKHIESQKDWIHDFGLANSAHRDGKMFGVLVVKNAEGELGYIAAFSGKLAGGNHHPKFVPPVFDSLFEGSFLNKGMVELGHITQQINTLEKEDSLLHFEEIQELKIRRKQHSISIQKELYDSYNFVNAKGEWKNLREIFKDNPNSNPPGGAGECAAPKLFQYAFLNRMKPIALAEFFWGVPPKGISWKHKEYYTSCTDKCGPILKFMLADLFIEK